MCWFAMRTFTGLSQYPVFKVQAAADSLHILRFCPLRAACVVFSGKEVHYAFAVTVSTTCQNFFPTTLRPGFQGPIGATKAPPDHFGRRTHDSMSTASTRLLECLCDRLRAAFRFQHALRSLVASGGAATKITIHLQSAQDLFCVLP
jgi:hypothetical protein